jgi:serine/threonine protein kinase
MIKREIEILKVCQHPTIIRLYDVFENNDFIYIVMELLSGGDLFGYLSERQFKISE